MIVFIQKCGAQTNCRVYVVQQQQKDIHQIKPLLGAQIHGVIFPSMNIFAVRCKYLWCKSLIKALFSGLLSAGL